MRTKSMIAIKLMVTNKIFSKECDEETEGDSTKDVKDIGERWHIVSSQSLYCLFAVDSACVFEDDEVEMNGDERLRTKRTSCIQWRVWREVGKIPDDHEEEEPTADGDIDDELEDQMIWRGYVSSGKVQAEQLQKLNSLLLANLVRPAMWDDRLSQIYVVGVSSTTATMDQLYRHYKHVSWTSKHFHCSTHRWILY